MEQPLASSSGPVGPLPLAGNGAAAPRGASTREAVREAPLPLLDQQTLRELRRGHWAAMEPFVQRYQDRLFATVFRLVGNPDDTADLVQETFVRAMQGVARFEGKSSLYTWLFRIAVNLAISHRRSSQYRLAVSLDGDHDGDDAINRQAAGLRRQLAQDTEGDPAVNVEQQLEYERLVAALARLEPEMRAVIVLRDVEECDYEQIAAILDVPIGTIKSRLFRARSALRDLLGHKHGTDAGTGKVA